MKYQTIKPEGDVAIRFQLRTPCIPLAMVEFFLLKENGLLKPKYDNIIGWIPSPRYLYVHVHLHTINNRSGILVRATKILSHIFTVSLNVGTVEKLKLKG